MANREDTSTPSSATRESLFKKLSAEVGVASWEALAPHAERGALFWVDHSLELAEVEVSLALDESDSVKAWHQAELILAAASSAPQDFGAFRFLIIQPFVIAAPLELPPVNDPISDADL